MVKNVSMSKPEQTRVPRLLSASIFWAFLISTTPAFAETDANRIKALESKIDSLQNDVSQMASGLARSSGESDGLPMHGFMDVGYANNTMADPVNFPKGFFVGSLSFYLTPHFGDKVKALIEPNFEVTPAGAVATDLERVQIGYTFSDSATGWMGRFHTPYGYWNTAFHHGAQMQTSVMRPRFLDFEDKGGILPSHMVGLWGTGKVRAGDGKFTYDIFAGNGPKIVMADPTLALPPPASLGILDMNQAGDDNHQAMVGINIGYEFSGMMDGLRFAVHSLRGDVSDDVATQFNKTELNMVGGSLVYLGNEWELMTELYRFNDKDKSGLTGEYKSSASYLQIGRAFGNLTPFVRKEIANLDQQDNYFSMQASGQSYTRYTGGFKYDLNPKASLKFEAEYSNFADEPGRTAYKYHTMYIQYAIRF